MFHKYFALLSAVSRIDTLLAEVSHDFRREGAAPKPNRGSLKTDLGVDRTTKVLIAGRAAVEAFRA